MGGGMSQAGINDERWRDAEYQKELGGVVTDNDEPS